MSDPKTGGRFSPGARRLAGMGVELAATLVAACLLGFWIDRRFETEPWGLMICSVLGIVGGLYNLIRQSVHEVFRTPTNEGKENDRLKKEKSDS